MWEISFEKLFRQSVDIETLKDIVPSPAAKAVLKKWYENQRAQFGVSTELDFRDARLRDGEVDRRLRHRRCWRRGSFQSNTVIDSYLR